MALARKRLYPGQGELALEGISGPSPRAGPVRRSSPASRTRCYDEAFAQLVLARIVEPTSKADSPRGLDDLGVPHASFRTLRCARFVAHDVPVVAPRAAGRDYPATIASACFAHAFVAGDVSPCPTTSHALLRSREGRPRCVPVCGTTSRGRGVSSENPREVQRTS